MNTHAGQLASGVVYASGGAPAGVFPPQHPIGRAWDSEGQTLEEKDRAVATSHDRTASDHHLDVRVHPVWLRLWSRGLPTGSGPCSASRWGRCSGPSLNGRAKEGARKSAINSGPHTSIPIRHRVGSSTTASRLGPMSISRATSFGRRVPNRSLQRVVIVHPYPPRERIY